MKRALTYLPYADSPTVKSYTRWDVFDRVFREGKGNLSTEGLVKERIPLLSDDFPFVKLHNQNAETFVAASDSIRVKSTGGPSFAHVKVLLEGGSVTVIEDSSDSPLSVTGEIEGSGEVFHIIYGKHPHFSRWNISGDFTVRTVVIGKDAYNRYVTRGNITAYGVSGGERTDVHHEFYVEGSDVLNVHLLIGDKDTFHVHRPVAKVYKGGKSHLETLLLKRGGFVTGVPSVEVYTSDVRGASHSVKDVVVTDEQRFYLRSRGIKNEEIENYVLEELMKYLLKDKKEIGMQLLSGQRYFSFR